MPIKLEIDSTMDLNKSSRLKSTTFYLKEDDKSNTHTHQDDNKKIVSDDGEKVELDDEKVTLTNDEVYEKYFGKST
jgi:hypothetical protein